MHFEPEATPSEIPILFNRFVAITGWKPWQSRLSWIQAQVDENPTMPDFMVERFELELAFEEIRRHLKTTGRFLPPDHSERHNRFYALMTMAALCHARLSEAGKKRLAGMLRDALRNDVGLGPVAFELQVATHLMMRGFDVRFRDMEEGGAGCDYIASRNGVELEIECKFISGDIGRQIHLKEFHHFCSRAISQLAKRSSDNVGTLVRVKIPSRLEGKQIADQEIWKSLLDALEYSDTTMEIGEYEVIATKFELSGSPFAYHAPTELTNKHLEDFLARQFGIEERNIFFYFRPKKFAVVMVVESVRTDRVLRSIHEELKDAARRQFSGERPGIICCYLAEISENELRELGDETKPASGLQVMSSRLLDQRPKIHTLAYMAAGKIKTTTSSLINVPQRTIQQSGLSYLFKNPKHPLSADSRYDIF